MRRRTGSAWCIGFLCECVALATRVEIQRSDGVQTLKSGIESVRNLVIIGWDKRKKKNGRD